MTVTNFEFEDKTTGLFVLALFIVQLGGIFWLTAKGLREGTIYFQLIGAFVFALIISFWLVKQSDLHIKIPLQDNLLKGTTMFFFGILLLLSLSFITNITTGYNFLGTTSQAFAPLTSFKSEPQSLTFSALDAQNNPGWIVFIVVFTAAINEELMLGFFAIVVGSLLFFIIRKLLKLDFATQGNKIFDFVGGMIVSVGSFMLLHTFNGTYTTISMFLYAGMFRLIMNLFIYFLSFGLEFSIGIHMLNNAAFLGFSTVMAGLLTFPGIFMILFIVLALLFTITNWKELPDIFKNLFSRIGI